MLDYLTLFAEAIPWLTVVVATAIAAGVVAALRPLAVHAGWVDHPGVRKTHVGAIPLVGGWAIVIALVLTYWLMRLPTVPSGYWIGALLLLIVASVDDRYPVRARYRLLAQMAAAVAGVMLGGQILPHVGDLLGLGPIASPWITVPVSIFGAMALINALNFSDGADGLCGGIGFIGLGWFLVAAVVAATALPGDGHRAYAPGLVPLVATMIGAIAGFLFFNLRTPWRARGVVFLGDNGSTLIGFTLAWVAIHVTSAYGATGVSPVACLWIVALPLADSASCFVRRMLDGVTPMTADTKHLHHLLLRSGMSVRRAVGMIHAASFVCGLVGVGGWLAGVADSRLFALFVIALIAFIAVTNLAWKRIDGARARTAQPVA